MGQVFSGIDVCTPIHHARMRNVAVEIFPLDEGGHGGDPVKVGTVFTDGPIKDQQYKSSGQEQVRPTVVVPRKGLQPLVESLTL